MRLALLLCLAVVSTAGASEPPPTFDDAVLDRTGCLWASSGSQNALHVYRFDGQHWEAQDCPPTQSKQPVLTRIATTADGAVACVWRLDDKHLAVTRHLGLEPARLLGVCAGVFKEHGLQTPLLADSKNRLWITGRFPQVYRADDQGVSLAHEITPEELDAPKKAKRGYNALRAVEDGRGRICVWSQPGAGDRANLRGVLVLDGEKTELHDPCATLKKGAAILTLARADERHLWMSVREDGIYRVDLDTFALERLPDPAPDALCCVHELFVDGGDLYAVEHANSSPEVLWRRRDGRWEEVLPALDVDANVFHPRPWLPVQDGLIVGADGAGPWFIPRQGAPAQYSWRSGFALESLSALLHLPDGTFFAVEPGSRTFRGELAMPPRDQETPRVVPINSDGSWTPDAGGRPWIVLKDAPTALSEWNGSQWVPHPDPGGENLIEAASPSADAEGRLWLNGVGSAAQIHVFDTKTGRWQIFPDTQAAYLTLREDPPHFLLNEQSLFDPQYSADRQRVAYRYDVGELRYYDGVTWQRIKRRQITGKPDDRTLGPPWFDADGKLCVNLLGKTTLCMGDGGKWSEVPFQSRFPADVWSEHPDNNHRVFPEPPEGCVTDEPESIVADNLGTCWLTWHGELYRCIPGHCVKVFDPGEPSPFRSERAVSAVYVDSRGNALLETSQSSGQGFILKPGSVPPHTTVTVDPVGADAVTARIQVVSALRVEIRWQLDGGPWQSTNTDTLALRDLPGGWHKLRVNALDAELQSDGSPAEAAFEIRVDPARPPAARATP